MISRKYSKKIKLYQSIITPDGYGGNEVGLVLIGSFWANVKQNSSFKDNTLGKADIKNSYTFKIRPNAYFSTTINNPAVEYKGVFYSVSSIEYADELFREVNIIANG